MGGFLAARVAFPHFEEVFGCMCNFFSSIIFGHMMVAVESFYYTIILCYVMCYNYV